jgi:uncharacterized membrane protein YphA (DoxX/SURF4 family)
MKVGAVHQLRDWGITVLRMGTGASFLLHEIHDGRLFAQGLSGQAVVECLCAAALVLGLYTRWVSITLAVGMSVDILLIHTPTSFPHVGIDFEYALLRLFATLALVLVGPGRAALGEISVLQRVPTLSRLQR